MCGNNQLLRRIIGRSFPKTGGSSGDKNYFFHFKRDLFKVLKLIVLLNNQMPDAYFY